MKVHRQVQLFFFASVSKIGLFIVFCRFIQINCDCVVFDWQYFVLCCGLLSIFWGSFLAFKQNKIKRLLAYSSISHVGYLLLAITTTTIEGFYSFFFYLFIYLLAVISIWCIVINIQNSVLFFRALGLGDFCSLFFFNSSLALSFLLAVFSMAGIPPLAGFYAKICIFFSVINSKFFFFATASFLITVVSTFFYIRLVKTAFFEKTKSATVSENLMPIQVNYLASSSFFLIFLFGNPLLLDVLAYRLALCFG